jgi:hypothetical protein
MRILLAPVLQNPLYHLFTDARTIAGIPNFWNVISNVPFLLAALYGVFRMRRAVFIEPWERLAFGSVLFGTAAVAFGSGYYHLHPDNGRLFWDRLPMTVVFMSLVAASIGERLSLDAGRRSLVPLLLLGIGSVLVWRSTGDLRLYALVQFGSMLAIPYWIVRFPARYTDSHWLWLLLAFYGVAKLLELFDRPLGSLLLTGGHPWKHLAAAGAIFCYIHMISLRSLLPDDYHCVREEFVR